MKKRKHARRTRENSASQELPNYFTDALETLLKTAAYCSASWPNENLETRLHPRVSSVKASKSYDEGRNTSRAYLVSGTFSGC